MPSRSMRFGLSVTPGLAHAGVPKTLWSAMPISVARIIGLRMATPGMRRSANASPATPAVSKRPGPAAKAP